MRYAGIIYDDTAAAPGLSLTLFTQGCPFHCKGCHNPETWDYEGGYEYTKETEQKIVKALSKNGIIRNLCIMGGEPLLPNNIESLYSLIKAVRDRYKDEIKIYLWTGFTTQELQDIIKEHPDFADFLYMFDYIIDGRYEEDKRDITLLMRGSTNQKINRVVDKFCDEKELPLKNFEEEVYFLI